VNCYKYLFELMCGDCLTCYPIKIFL